MRLELVCYRTGVSLLTLIIRGVEKECAILDDDEYVSEHG